MTSLTWKKFDAAAGLSGSLDRQGFTLLELLLAIGAMSLLLGLNLPRIGAVKKAYFASEEAKEVVNFVRAARLDAIVNRTTVGLAIATGDRNHLEERRLPSQSWYDEESSGFATENRDWRGIWETAVTRSIEVSGRLRLESIHPGILFFANGSSSGGEIMIHDEDGSLRHHFLIDAVTGELFIQKGLKS